MTTGEPFALPRVDYTDSYGVDLAEPMDAERFATLILRATPRWLELALRARDVVAGPLGFSTQERTDGAAPVRVVPGAKLGPLVVRSVSAQRVVCADRDRHLAFRATFETSGGRAAQGRFTTEVEFRDLLGRAYFTAIKPFHRLIVPRLVGGPFSGPARPSAAPTRADGPP